MAARKSATKPKAKGPRSKPQPPQPAAAAVVYNRDVGRDGNTSRQT